MKITILLLFLSFYSYSQTATFNKVAKGDYTSYISKNKDTINIGDKLLIGLPTLGDRYAFISQGEAPAGTVITFKEVTINKIQAFGKKSNGYKIFLQFKGYGLLPILIDYEPAFYSNEIILKY